MIYLKAENIVRINAKIITTTSKGEMIGIRDAAALDMAIKQPQQSVFGEELYPTIFDKAAILVINLTKKHPFYNANKRTAFVSMVTFLEVNGYTTDFSRTEAVNFILDITNSNKDFDILKQKVSNYLRKTDKVFKDE